MCMNIISETKPEAKVAEQDIVCYKELNECWGGSGKLRSEFMGFEYTKGKLNELDGEIGIEKGYMFWITNEWKLNEGFHSWVDKPKYNSNGFKRRIFKCIIPKGALYYEGIQHDDTSGYVSDKIIVKECAYYVGFWSFLFDSDGWKWLS